MNDVTLENAQTGASVESAETRLPRVGDVTPRGTIFGVRVTEEGTFLQFSQSGEWLPA